MVVPDWLRVLILLGCAASLPQAQHRILLTDTATNRHFDGFFLSAAELGYPGDWSVRRETLRGGKQEGVDRIVIDAGRVVAEILPTRGMSIHSLRCDGVRLGWDSPSSEIVHPALIDLESRGGLGWLEGFNEWMVRCGLEFAGHPGEDVLVDADGNETRRALSLHGRVGNLPAARVELLIDERPPHRLRLRGTVLEQSFYGAKLRLQTEFSVVPGEARWRLSDTVTNTGAQPQEMQLIYHANYRTPLLGAGARVVVPARRIAPMTPKAEAAFDGWDTYGAPEVGFEEEVFLIEPYADAAGRSRALLVDPAGERATSVSWHTSELPYFTLWKNTAALADGYVTGLEPGTSFPFNRRVERAAGRVPVLAPGASRSFTLDYDFVQGAERVREAEAQVRAIQGERSTERLGVPE